MNKKINVTVLSGGFSNERDISLLSGKQVYDALDKKKYNVKLINLSRKNFLELPVLLQKTHICFLALHGKFGEDGHIQALLNIMNIPYTGSGMTASALCMDKYKSLSIAKSAGATVPKSLTVTVHQPFDLLEKKVRDVLKYPVFVKPNASGSSVGAGIAKHKKELKVRIKESAHHDEIILVQEMIVGRELTCAVFGNTGYQISALPPAEIKIKKGFFDREVKYASNTIELCPAPLTKAQTQKIQHLAEKVHVALGCDGVSRSDFLLKGNKFYYLETNTIPGLTENSLAPKEAKAHGLGFSEYLDLQVMLALQKKVFKIRYLFFY